MSQNAAHLVDHVTPHAPLRQWVLSLPIAAELAHGEGLQAHARAAEMRCEVQPGQPPAPLPTEVTRD